MAEGLSAIIDEAAASLERTNKRRLCTHEGTCIHILATDKNLGPAVVTKAWYEKEVSWSLSDDLFYRKVDVVPSTSTKKVLVSILDRFGQSLGDKLKSYILQFADVHDTAYFKILPKVHKINVLWLVDP